MCGIICRHVLRATGPGEWHDLPGPAAGRPWHRLHALDHIRKQLRAGELCQVVSTQQVEAGVNADFPLALRALAPLDSIVRPPGRAEREEKLAAALGDPGGKVVVFLPEVHKRPRHEYKEAAGITAVIAKHELLDNHGVQVDSAVAFRDNFQALLWGKWNGPRIESHRFALCGGQQRSKMSNSVGWEPRFAISLITF
jgi:hypothetical protein